MYFAVSPCQIPTSCINEAQNQPSLRHCKVTHFLLPLGGQAVRPANPTRPEARRKNAMWQLAPLPPPHTWPMQHIYKDHDRPSVFSVGAPIPLHHSFITIPRSPLVHPSPTPHPEASHKRHVVPSGPRAAARVEAMLVSKTENKLRAYRGR